MALRNYYVDLNINGNEIKNVVIDKVGSIPATGTPGQVVYNTGDNKLYYYDGGNWIKIGDVSALQGTAPIQVSTSGGVTTVSIDPARTNAAGSMSATDKAKLDSLKVINNDGDLDHIETGQTNTTGATVKDAFESIDNWSKAHAPANFANRPHNELKLTDRDNDENLGRMLLRRPKYQLSML